MAVLTVPSAEWLDDARAAVAQFVASSPVLEGGERRTIDGHATTLHTLTFAGLSLLVVRSANGVTVAVDTPDGLRVLYDDD